MILETYEQQPADRLDYDIHYDDWLSPGDAVDAKTVVVTVDKPDLTVFITITGNTVKVWVEGGTNKTTYKITVTVETDDGRKKQDEFIVKVKDY